MPIARRDNNNQWSFDSSCPASSHRQNVLIVRPDAIGDFVIFSIILPHFRTLHPEAKITLLLQDAVAQLAQECPCIDEIITFNSTRIRDAQYRSQILTQLQSRHFDIAYYPVYSRSEIGDLLTLQSGAVKKVAFNGDCLNISAELKRNNDKYYDELIPAAPGLLLETHRNCEFMKGLGVDVPHSQGTTIWLNKKDDDYVVGLLKDLNISNPVVISPFARFGIKDWPLDKWAQLLSHYPDESIIICSAPEDYERAQKLISMSSHSHIYNLCGKTTLSQTAALMGHCKLYIGVDTGPAHMAIAANIPNVVLMGGGHFGRFMPYSPSTTMVYCKVSCANCNWRCRFGVKPAPCLTQISVPTVIRAINTVVSQPISRRKEPLVITETAPYEAVAYRIKEAEPDNSIFTATGAQTSQIAESHASRISETAPKYLVSAIVSAYNSEKYIRGCLEALENQTIADKLEIIVVDSGSQQNEAAIVKEFQQRYNNIKYIRTERETIYGAWNRAVKASSGKYITNANTDDRHYSDALESLADALEKNPDKAVSYGNQHFVSEIGGEIIRERRSKQGGHLEMLSGQFWLESQPMWRRDLHNTIGYFDEQFFCGGDYEFWIRATQHFELIYIDKFTGKRFVGDSVVSRVHKELQSLEVRIIAQSYEYAIQTREPIGKHGISGDARFADWPEIKAWNRMVAAKLSGRQRQSSDEIVDVKDMRTGCKPKLSVVAIETDATKWQCIQSLVSQSYQNFELILIAYRNLPSQSDLAAFAGRVCIIQLKEDIGAAFARNVGIAYAKGDFLAYLDSSMQANRRLG